MEIWMTWAKRKARCRFCEQPIEKATPVVKGKMWRKLATGTKWSYMFYWHPECWLKAAYIYLEQHPFVPKRGRAKLALDESTRAQRLRLLRERARLTYRLREIALYGDDGSAEERILDRLIELVAEIEPLGGAPKSWGKLPAMPSRES